MHCVYILKSLKFKDKFYVGYTEDLDIRLKQHNKGLSFHTKKYMPWKIVYFEAYANQEDAKDREKKLKQFGKVYSQLKRRIKKTLAS